MVDQAVSILAWALAAMFLWAAGAKAIRPHQTRRSFEALGLAMPGVLAAAVPLLEGAISIALVLVPPWGGAAAFGLMAVFTTVLARVVRSGLVVSCACFGAATNAPVSKRTLIRNAVVLLASAAVAIFAS